MRRAHNVEATAVIPRRSHRGAVDGRVADAAPVAPPRGVPRGARVVPRSSVLAARSCSWLGGHASNCAECLQAGGIRRAL